jgi:Predicted acyl-CoA transferases/carnitine dehydratase
MSAQLPLHGIKVIDLGQYIAGPGAAMILLELGADVSRSSRCPAIKAGTPAFMVTPSSRPITAARSRSRWTLRTRAAARWRNG